MDDLSLQIGGIHHVEVHQTDATNPGCRQVHQQRRPQPARANTQDTGSLEPPLALQAHLVQEDVPAVTSQLVPIELGQRFGISGVHADSKGSIKSWLRIH